MKNVFIIIILFITLKSFAFSKDNSFYPDDLFHIDHMDSHNKKFALYFKGREKSILARGEESNYINDYPKDLYIYNYSTKSSSPLISYDWFPSQAKFHLEEYDFPVFPDDFAYYLLKRRILKKELAPNKQGRSLLLKTQHLAVKEFAQEY